MNWRCTIYQDNIEAPEQVQSRDGTRFHVMEAKKVRQLKPDYAIDLLVEPLNRPTEQEQRLFAPFAPADGSLIVRAYRR